MNVLIDKSYNRSAVGRVEKKSVEMIFFFLKVELKLHCELLRNNFVINFFHTQIFY